MTKKILVTIEVAIGFILLGIGLRNHCLGKIFLTCIQGEYLAPIWRHDGHSIAGTVTIVTLISEFGAFAYWMFFDWNLPVLKNWIARHTIKEERILRFGGFSILLVTWLPCGTLISAALAKELPIERFCGLRLVMAANFLKSAAVACLAVGFIHYESFKKSWASIVILVVGIALLRRTMLHLVKRPIRPR